MNTGDTVQISPFLAGIPHGSVTYTSLGVTPVFFGVQDSAGFDAITFTVGGPINRFLGLDNLRFEAIPEPSTWSLLAGGAAVLAALRRKFPR